MYVFAFILFVLSFTLNNKDENFVNSKKSFYSDTLKANIDSSYFLKDSLIYKKKIFKEKSSATFYSDKFNGRKTASGKLFDNSNYTAAHKTLPFGTKVLVTNLANNKAVMVTVTDRGPFAKGKEIDLTKKAFLEIAKNKNEGIISVKIEVLEQLF